MFVLPEKKTSPPLSPPQFPFAASTFFPPPPNIPCLPDSCHHLRSFIHHFCFFYEKPLLPFSLVPFFPFPFLSHRLLLSLFFPPPTSPHGHNRGGDFFQRGIPTKKRNTSLRPFPLPSLTPPALLPDFFYSPGPHSSSVNRAFDCSILLNIRALPVSLPAPPFRSCFSPHRCVQFFFKFPTFLLPIFESTIAI